MNAYVVEHVAGLVDEGESVESAARRELREEVGYTNVTVVSSSPRGVPMDPGMSNSCIAMVHVEVDGSDPTNRPSNLVAEPEVPTATAFTPTDDIHTHTQWHTPPQQHLIQTCNQTNKLLPLHCHNPG